MQIHEITRKPLNELANMPTATGTSPMKVTYGPGIVKPAAATPTSGSAPTATTATSTPAPATSGSTGGTLNKVTGAVANSAPGKVLGGAAAVAGGIAGALGKSLMSKAFGGVDVMGKFAGQPMNRAQALKLGQEMSKTLLPVLQQNWANQVQAALAQSRDPVTKAPSTSPAKLTSGEKSVLKSQLTAMVNQAIQPRGNFNYTTLANYVGDDTTPEGQTVKATAMQTIQEITKAIDGIFQDTLAGTNPAQDWQNLVVSGIAPAQGVLAFDSATGLGYGGTGARRAALSSQDLSLATQLGLNATDVAELQQAARNPTQKAQLIKMLGLQS
jgi:hypothetical protein